MLEESMTPCERWLAVLEHRKLDRVPMFYRATGEVTERQTTEYKEWFNYSLFHKGINKLPAELYECNVNNLTGQYRKS